MSHDELAQVEAIANEIVLQNDAVTTRLMSVDAAIAEGAMALFGEKYGDEVRVVSMGRNTHGAGRPIYSLELCGGTHVSRTGDIGLIKVISESAVGCRRAPRRGAGGTGRARLSRRAGPPRAGGGRGAQGPGLRNRQPHRGADGRAPQARDANWPKPRSSWPWAAARKVATRAFPRSTASS